MDKKIINLTQDELEKLARFIQKEFGIFLNNEQLKRAQKKIQNLIAEHNFKNFTSFYHQIRFTKNERLKQALVNAITINETYFWREHEQFEVLAFEALHEFKKHNRPIRILVAPSSSGEELYSMMFAILEEQSIIQKYIIELIGIDVDSNVIQKAKKGVYSKRSVEKLPKRFLERYFTQKGNLFELDVSLRQHVTFLQGNIFDTHFTNKLGTFDIIFSRNMLIYFDLTQKKEAFDTFYKMLHPHGLLFLGHADSNELDKNQFKPYKSGFHIYKKI